MKNYNLKARICPSIISLTPALYCLYNVLIDKYDFELIMTSWASFIKLTGGIAISTAISYFISTIISNIGKIFYENLLWGNNQVSKPSNLILLMNNTVLSIDKKERIRNKIRIEFNFVIPDDRDDVFEKEKVLQCIDDIMPNIRNMTRSDVVLFDKLCQYGFFRNLFGGCFIGLTVLIATIILDKNAFSWPEIIAIIYTCLLLLSIPIVNYFGCMYAKALFNAYLSHKNTN